jgi:hypothetical protein
MNFLLGPSFFSPEALPLTYKKQKDGNLSMKSALHNAMAQFYNKSLKEL